MAYRGMLAVVLAIVGVEYGHLLGRQVFEEAVNGAVELGVLSRVLRHR